MIGNRIEIRGTLEVLSPLQIGSGESAGIDRGDGEVTSLRLVERDGANDPFMPGSTLKGVMRQEMTGHGGLGSAFGPDRISGATDAAAGKVIFRNAWFAAPPSNKAQVSRRNPAVPHDATYVETHIAKDADAGVAAKALLFQNEAVLPGTTFTLSLALCDLSDEARAFVQDLLGRLAQEGGVAFGRAGRQGMGRVRLLENSVDAYRVPGNKPEKIVPMKAKGTPPKHRLALVSDVPFQIHDPHRKPPHAPDGEVQRNNSLLALQAFDGSGARLTGSTLMGALRAAFADFAARKGNAAPVERLFGTTSQRGRVRIDALSCNNQGHAKTITSVKLDRFSGAPIDNALFAAEGFVGTEYHVDLTLEARGAQLADDQAADEALFTDFLKELQGDIFGGLMLGHGSSRGFGWFTVKER